MAEEYANDYQVIDIDLAAFGGAAGVSAKELVQDGRPISAVTIVELPPAAVGLIKLHFGPRGDGIKLRAESVTVNRVPARMNGLYLTCPSGLAGNLELLIGLDVVSQSL